MKQLFLAAVAFIVLAAHAQAAERRIALVVGTQPFGGGLADAEGGSATRAAGGGAWKAGAHSIEESHSR